LVQYCWLTVPRSELEPARVIIAIEPPVPWPCAASKFDVSTRISSIMSALGALAMRRPLPAFVAPSIV
jgi:hypothetical protein